MPQRVRETHSQRFALLQPHAFAGYICAAITRSDCHAVFHAKPGQARARRQAGGGHLLRAVAAGIRAGVFWRARRPARLPDPGSLPARDRLPGAEHGRRPRRRGQIAASDRLRAVFVNSDKFARSDLPAFSSRPVMLRPLKIRITSTAEVDLKRRFLNFLTDESGAT